MIRSASCVAYLPERCVDPRTLMAAAVKAAKHREVDISSGSEVREVLVENGRVAGVKTEKTSYASGIVVNCAGAWQDRFCHCNFRSNRSKDKCWP